MYEEFMKMTPDEQKAAALVLMKELELRPDIIRKFAAHKTVFKSVNGKIFPLSSDEVKMIIKFKKETGHLVYHIICSEMESCKLYNLLYVCADAGDFREYLEMIKQCTGSSTIDTIAYCMNITIPAYSEFGLILMKRSNGALIRIW